MNSNASCFKVKILSIAVVSGLISNYAQAEEVQKIETITVTASVLGNSEVAEIKKYEGTRNILTSDVLQKTAARSIDDALQQVPGVKVLDETGTGVLPNVSVRGLESSRSGYAQFLLDGIPLSLAPYGHTGQSLFPATLAMIDRIDVVRGGAAVQYGPNNVGGVLNIISKPITEEWKTSLNERITFFGDKKSLYDTAFSTGGSVNEYFDLRFSGNVLSGESFRDHSDTDVQNWMLQTKWKINDNQSLATTLQYYEADTELPGALNTEAYEKDRTQSLRPNDDFQADTIRFSTSYNHILGEVGAIDYAEFDLITFANKSNRNFNWDYSTTADHWADTSGDATHLRSSPRDFTVVGIEPRATAYIDGKISQDWIIGSRYVNEDINYKLNQKDYVTDISSTLRDWHMDTNAMAYYVSNKLGFFDESFTVTPGLRYEDVRSTFSNISSNYNQDNHVKELLPSLTIGYEFSNEWFAYANAQKSLKTPQISQLSAANQEDILVSEISWNYEAGLRFTPTKRTNVSLALYRIGFENKIEFNSDESQYENIGETLSQGIEIEGQYSPESISELILHASYTFLDTEQLEGDYKGNDLPFASKHQFTASALYDYEGYDLGLSAYYYSKSFSDSANTVEENDTGTVGELPSYTVVNLSVNKELYKKDAQSLTAGIAVNNVFDNEYYFRGLDVSPAGRVAALGRSVSLNIGYDF